MKPYPIPECKGACHQGDKPCTTEALCTTWLHRFPLPITKESPSKLTAAQVTDAEYAEETHETTLSWALFVVVSAFAVGIVILPFLLGAV